MNREKQYKKGDPVKVMIGSLLLDAKVSEINGDKITVSFRHPPSLMAGTATKAVYPKSTIDAFQTTSLNARMITINQ